MTDWNEIDARRYLHLEDFYRAWCNLHAPDQSIEMKEKAAAELVKIHHYLTPVTNGL
jgi:hypothetical protein